MKKYYFLAVAVVVIYFLQSFFVSAGGIGADSLSYFGIAADIPHVETNLFPLGYPFLIKVYHLLFLDYFWASKILNISLLIGILLFSYFKKFYFRETVLLFTGKTLFYVYNNVMSESVFIFLLYLLLYCFHERVYERLSSRRFLLSSAVLMVSLFATRYSGIFVFAGVVAYAMYFLYKNKQDSFRKDMMLFLAVSGVGIFGYLAVNYFCFGSFTGENLRGEPASITGIDVLRNFLGLTNVVNPYIGIKPASNSIGSLGFQIFLMFLDVCFIIYALRFFRRRKKFINLQFHYLLWCIAVVYSVMLFVSGFFQQIEEINMRMLAAANFCLFFSMLIIYFNKLENDVAVFSVGVFFLIFLLVYSVKIPVNFLENRKEISAQMAKFKDKKFLYNDEKNRLDFTEYRVPFTNNIIRYNHTGRQAGEVKQNIAGSLNPKIKWIKNDSLAPKEQILYTSQLHLPALQ